ncbi:response regulator [Oleisolibacter albus]|uniref:response regulator n=1 Tax=Oleisolibacter albus TaxID=2171757 RepID=UPI001EFDAB1B|nr:response regulator [Oleisolibacter albus]
MIIVEDEALVGMMFEAALSQAGYRVSLTRDGVEALALDALDPADAVVTDLRMPRMDGRTLIPRLRERNAALPILVVTGYQGDAGPVGLGDPLIRFFTKPISPRILAQKLDEMLDRRVA